jgi:FixJ family two-component response regulator
VFITGLGDETVRPRALAEGAAECLLKPFSEASLCAAIDIALRMGRMPRGACDRWNVR